MPPTLLFIIGLVFFLFLAFIGMPIAFAFGLVGGGDAKLLAAASLWIGFNDLGQYMFAVVLMGGLLSIMLLVYRGMLPPSWLLGQSWALRLHNKKEGIPYGLALSGAALWIFPATGWFTAVAV